MLSDLEGRFKADKMLIESVMQIALQIGLGEV